ncbi:MAG TPA: ABC transporter permease [Candidatus Limnocylindrales bacterium]|nr:ABC transporter permease [Candidatus Limnocylindrales bacterium]
MTKYVVRRLIQAVPVLIGITIVIYAIMLSAPGGPIQRFAQNPRVTNAQRDAFIRSWGLDQPIPVQYCRWLGLCDPNQDGIALVTKSGVPNLLPSGLGGGTNGMLHGDLGSSIDSGEAVATRIGKAALPTLILAGTALFIWITIAILLGVLAAIRRYSFFDQAVTVFSYVGFAMPTFWLGLMLILIFGAALKVLPVSGMTDTRLSPPFGSDQYWVYFGAQPLTALADLLRHLILPVITLVTVNIAGDSRFVRASMLETLGQDYVRTASAKGLPRRTVVFRHALRNALLPVVTNIGLEIPFLFSGAIVTESIFSWPGEGKLFINSITSFDYTILMGILLITALLTVLANLLADILYAVVDPRIKY